MSEQVYTLELASTRCSKKADTAISYLEWGWGGRKVSDHQGQGKLQEVSLSQIFEEIHLLPV